MPRYIRAKVVKVFRASEPLDADRFFDDLYGGGGLDDSFGDPDEVTTG